MNVKMKELQGRLEKSARRSLMVKSLCGDDKFVSRVIDWEPAKTYESIDKWVEHWNAIETDDEKLGDIANAAIVSFKNANKGRDAVERAKNFLDAFTSMLFESKDELEKDDYCNAVVQLRLIGKEVLSEGKSLNPNDSRQAKQQDNNPHEEGEVDPSKVKAFAGRKTNFRWHLALKVANDAVKNADTEKGKKELDKKEAEQAAKILEFVNSDPKLLEMVCSFGEQFSNWIAEQLFGLKPEVVEVVGTVPGDDRKKTATLFNQFILWLKGNDPNGYVRYLAESTEDLRGEAEVTININGAGEQADEQPKIEDKEVSKYLHRSPWEIYQECKDDPEFTRCWVS